MASLSIEEKAERLRLQGNDAFSTKDWERAADLYRQSDGLGGSFKTAAKTNSNLAATLCKLSRYDEAADAAERATTLDPTWAKAWWRRGVVAELRKLFLDALSFYELATDLEPNEKVFSKALANLKKVLKVSESRDGTKTIGARTCQQVTREDAKKLPSNAAWEKMLQVAQERNVPPELAVYSVRHIYDPLQEKYPTSEQWFVKGLTLWAGGMKSAVGHLTEACRPDARREYQAIRRMTLSEQEKIGRTVQILGGIPTGQALEFLTSGFASLGGLHIVIETGGTSNDPVPPSLLCPQPQHLSFLPTYQSLAIMISIVMASTTVADKLGSDFKSSRAIPAATLTLSHNLRGPGNSPPDVGKPSSPQEVVDYIKDQLQAGKTWDGGLRQFCSLQYRGTLLFAGHLRLMGQVADAYQLEKWAHEFITLADEEFKVSEEGTYEEKGSAFRPSFRIGMMVSMSHTQNALRGDEVWGPYPMSETIDLLLEIVEMAKRVEVVSEPNAGDLTDYYWTQNDVAWRRKPLASAHSSIASLLNTLKDTFSPEQFHEIASHHSFVKQDDDFVDPYVLIAAHYQLAAEAELPDADHGALYWWAYGANMARAEEKSGFTLGQLRSAISKAEEAEDARDLGLFGPNAQRGASFETISKLTADHFKDEDDAFILPQVEIVREGSTSTLKVGDKVICEDYASYETKEIERYVERRKKEQSAMIDSSNVDEFGPSYEDRIPSLETLCVRELHKADCEHAVGETDGAVIYCKAMMASEKHREKA